MRSLLCRLLTYWHWKTLLSCCLLRLLELWYRLALLLASLQRTIANAAGAVGGISNLAVTSSYECVTYCYYFCIGAWSCYWKLRKRISGVIGNTNANGDFHYYRYWCEHFHARFKQRKMLHTLLVGLSKVETLGQVDKVISSQLRPLTILLHLHNRLLRSNVAIVAAVDVPQANSLIYAAAVQTSLALYFASLPIGGNNGEIDIDIILGVSLRSRSKSEVSLT